MAKEGISVREHSFISLQPNNASFEVHQNANWLFFISPRSARLFFEIYKPNGQIKFAALSEGTAKVIRNLTHSTVDFVGTDDDMLATANAFKQLVNNDDVVVFPSGFDSKRRIQGYYKSDSWLDFIFYSTEISDDRICLLGFDGLFLSSTTQVKGALKNAKNGLPKHIFTFIGSTSEFLASQEIETILVDSFNRNVVFNTIINHFS